MADIDPDAFATCCYVEIDLRRGRAMVTRAGHPPLVLRSSSGRTRVIDVAVGLPLGVDPDEIYVAEPVHLFPGDTLVLFTDGLVEDSRTTMDSGLAMVSTEVRTGDVSNIESFADRLVSRQNMAEHRPDDIAVLAVRYEGLDVTQRPRRTSTVIDRGDPRAARNAREFISRVLGEWDLIGQREAVVLLVSEVVTNAVLHARSDVFLTVSDEGEIARVEVRDSSPVPPRLHRFAVESATGRGLRLLDQLALRWGADQADGELGKTVWFEVGSPGEAAWESFGDVLLAEGAFGEL